jgi:hypothetical protein
VAHWVCRRTRRRSRQRSFLPLVADRPSRRLVRDGCSSRLHLNGASRADSCRRSLERSSRHQPADTAFRHENIGGLTYSGPDETPPPEELPDQHGVPSPEDPPPTPGPPPRPVGDN